MDNSKIATIWSALLFVCSLTIQSGFFTHTAEAQLASGQSKFVGNIVANGNNIPSNFNDFWNNVTAENDGKWGSLEPQQGNWNWGPLTNIYNYAQQNGFPFRQHTFVWGNQEPPWIASASQGVQYGALEYFMTEYGQRFPNTAFIDVVNEPISDPPSYTAALGGGGSTGWDWVVTAFQMARQTNPNAQLHINEYGIINDPNKAQQYVQIINILNNQGLIDGIGIQCHAFSMDNVAVSTMNQVLNMLAGTGLPIYVTELDIRGSDAQQLQRYQEKFPVLYEHPAVQGITLWGYMEGVIWMEGAHLLRSNGTERPALQWLRDYLASAGPPPGGGGSNTILVRARGVQGSEIIRLTVGGTEIGSWTLSTNMQNYTASTNLTGGINVEFINDDGPRDVQVDYIEVNGDRRYAADQSYNTAVWQNGSCGGSFSQWMHCNGAIGFGDVTGGGGSGNTVLVRARGVQGSEVIRLTVGGTEVGSWTLSTNMQNYTANTTLTSGGINVEFINDDGPRDVQVDYIEINGGSRRYAADQSYNTAVWQNGSCGGSFSQWMHCNGAIGFGDISWASQEEEDAIAASDIGVMLPEEFNLAAAYPNPFNPSTVIGFDLPEQAAVTLVVYDAVGREVARLVDGSLPAGRHERTFDAAMLSSGIYYYRFAAQGGDGQMHVQTRSVMLLK
jgi:endo-1,4-beta-xylanase